jgi:hypothetical protein
MRESAMRRLRHPPVAGLGALSILLAAAISPAAAQNAGPAMTTAEIRACLCQKQSMERQQDAVDTQGVLLEERQQELNSLDAEIKRQAAVLPGDDQVGQQVLQDLIHQQMALRTLIQLEIRPAQNRSLAALRQSVEAYNAQCTGRPRYALDVEQAETDLVCPAP